MRRYARLCADGAAVALVLALAVGPTAGCAKKQGAQGESTGVPEKLGEAAGEVAGTAESLGARVSRGVKATTRRAEEGKTLVSIRGALVADAALGASKIDVSVDEAAHTVALSGTVSTEEEKQNAERIARQKAPGYTIRNDIRVSGP